MLKCTMNVSYMYVAPCTCHSDIISVLYRNKVICMDTNEWCMSHEIYNTRTHTHFTVDYLELYIYIHYTNHNLSNQLAWIKIYQVDRLAFLTFYM